MTVKILSDRLDFGGALIAMLSSEAELRSLFGTSREESIPLHGGGVHTRCVFDRHGLVIHRDEGLLEISAIFFALSAEDTPGVPARPFSGSLLLGDVPLHSDLTEARLPNSGSVPLHSEFPHSWRFRGSDFTVHLAFRRRRTGSGKRTGIHRLAYASISFQSHHIA